MPNLSYWEKDAFFNNIDVAIIGSGIVGLNAAIYLKENAPNLNVVVLERGALPIGASTRNAGFACFGSISELLSDLDHHDEATMLKLVEKRWLGLQKLRSRLGDQAIGYEENGGYELFLEEDQFQACAQKIHFFNQLLAPIIGRKEIYQIVDGQIPHFGFAGVKHLICNQAEGQINTGKMMQSLLALARSKSIEVFNGIEVKSLGRSEGGSLIRTEDGWEIKTRKVLIATNGFAKNLLPHLNVKPARNQVLITQPISNLKWKGTFHFDEGYFYFRNIDGRILFGGGRNLDPEQEETDLFGFSKKIQNDLKEKLQQIIAPAENIKIDHWWSGILGVGDQKNPIIKSIGDGVFVSVRMGGMGVAIGSLVGEEGGKMVLEDF